MNNYFDPRRPGSFGSPALLARYSNQTMKSAEQFLSGQPAYTLHKGVRRKFARRRIYAKGIYDLLQCDLADMSQYSSSNGGVRYLLVCICAFSKQLWVAALRTKTSREVADAFDRIITIHPNFVQTDKGTEFIGEPFQSMLRRRSIKWYTSENSDIKCSIAERVIRTIKSKIHKYMTYRATHRYIDVLDDIVFSYNNTHHRSIGMAPHEVNENNSFDVAKRLYPAKPTKFKFKYKLNDRVRISYTRDVFRKGYVNQWSDELFTITSLYPTTPVTYGLTDSNGEVLKGRFYEFEIQSVKSTPGVNTDLFVIDRILKTRVRRGVTEYLVRWKGFGKKDDSWVGNVTTVQQ